MQATAYKGHDQIVQWLLKTGAEVNAQGGWDSTALGPASARSHDQIVKRLKSALQFQLYDRPPRPSP
jgi:hypothetical protein